RSHRHSLLDIDAALHRSFGKRPYNAIVASRRSGRMIGGSGHGPEAAARNIHLRTDSLDLIRLDELCLGAKGLVDFGASALGANTGLTVRKPQQALVAMHDSPARIALQGSVQIDAPLIEPHSFGDAVIGANNRRVAAGIAGADILSFEDGDIRDAVI